MHPAWKKENVLIAAATPSADSDIRIEVWLPAENWNGRFQAHGNGGFAGCIDYVHLAISILGGYASANTRFDSPRQQALPPQGSD